MASCGSTEKKATEQTEACAEAYDAKIEIISTPIDFEKDYSERIDAVTNRLKDIRTAERQYKSRH
jgi:hypothetical protein